MKTIITDRIRFSKKKVFRILVAAAGLAVFTLLLARLGAIEKTEIVSTAGYSYQRAEVTAVTKDNLSENGIRVGYQQLKVRLLTGAHKGELLDATSSEGNLFGAVCAVGDRVIVTVSTAGDTSAVSVYAQDRMGEIFVFVGIFLLLICVIGGKNGVKSVLGLIFTFVCIVYLYLPMIYLGISPFLSAVVVSVVTTVITMYLIGGCCIKTGCAIAGTTFGVLMAGLSAALFGWFADIDGYNVSNIETLVFVGQNTRIQIGGLLFSGILIASLGAVMDVAMSVASAMNEIHDQSPGLSWRALFASGMHVGRDMMGTMSNTLILAFAGGSLSTLVIDYAYHLPFMQLINSYAIGIEIMQGVAGSIGVILTVPSVALLTALLLGRRKKTAEKIRQE